MRLTSALESAGHARETVRKRSGNSRETLHRGAGLGVFPTGGFPCKGNPGKRSVAPRRWETP